MVKSKIGTREIGDHCPIYTIADLGLTNGGDINQAVALIEAARDIGVDAVKFQMIDADQLLGDKTIEYSFPTLRNGTITQNMHKMFKGLEFNDEQWWQLKHAADGCGLDMIVTAHYEGAVERVNRLALPVNKICTWSLSHRRMIEDLAKNGKSLICDTGTITKDDIIALEKIYHDAGGGDLIILHDFHTSAEEEMNFKALSVYRELGLVAGYTPQGRSDWLDYMAVGMGAALLEKRLTLSRDIPENGHWKAHEPEEFATWLAQIRRCEAALGEAVISPTTQDLSDAKKYYKSAYLVRDVKQGEVIKQADVVFMRPGTGISSWDFTDYHAGQNYARDYKSGDMFDG